VSLTVPFPGRIQNTKGEGLPVVPQTGAAGAVAFGAGWRMLRNLLLEGRAFQGQSDAEATLVERMRKKKGVGKEKRAGKGTTADREIEAEADCSTMQACLAAAAAAAARRHLRGIAILLSVSP